MSKNDPEYAEPPPMNQKMVIFPDQRPNFPLFQSILDRIIKNNEIFINRDLIDTNLHNLKSNDITTLTKVILALEIKALRLERKILNKEKCSIKYKIRKFLRMT